MRHARSPAAAAAAAAEQPPTTRRPESVPPNARPLNVAVAFPCEAGRTRSPSTQRYGRVADGRERAGRAGGASDLRGGGVRAGAAGGHGVRRCVPRGARWVRLSEVDQLAGNAPAGDLCGQRPGGDGGARTVGPEGECRAPITAAGAASTARRHRGGRGVPAQSRAPPLAMSMAGRSWRAGARPAGGACSASGPRRTHRHPGGHAASPLLVAGCVAGHHRCSGHSRPFPGRPGRSGGLARRWRSAVCRAAATGTGRRLIAGAEQQGVDTSATGPTER
eukprot:ctg_4535.g820